MRSVPLCAVRRERLSHSAKEPKPGHILKYTDANSALKTTTTTAAAAAAVAAATTTTSTAAQQTR